MYPTSEQAATHLQYLKLLANTIRGLSIDAVEAARSGHPGMPMGMADVAAVLWKDFLKHNPANPHWFDRDRFVLSAGHGSMLLYSLLHLFGYELPLEALKNFRQWGSPTPGHPEYGHTPGVETTTGPLGQGIATAVGMAIAEASLAGRFNDAQHRPVDHYTWVIASDGDLEEGISHEACSLAGHLKLGKLIVLYDDNRISIDGPTQLSFSEDVCKRFEAYGWHVQRINGHDFQAIRKAIQWARDVSDKPSLIACRTTIGYGSPNKAGTASVHGEPLGEEEARLAKAQLGLPADQPFFIPEQIRTLAETARQRGQALEAEWHTRVAAFKQADEARARRWEATLAKDVPREALEIPEFEPGKPLATRAASGKVLDHLAPLVPALMGGSADLTPSNKTFPKGETAFSAHNRKGRYLHYGVREHTMAAIMNGMALHGGVLPYAGTFFVFTDYMRAAMRLSALMGVQVIYVLTHDSIGLGEDGPTHQPIEHLASLRAMPHMRVIRPMDAPETAEAWKMALLHREGPTCLILTRQALPVTARAAEGLAPATLAHKGGYVLCEDEGFDRILIATGSEVHLALEAKKLLNAQGYKVRLVNMPCTEVFDQQPAAYREAVLPSRVRKRVAVEAAATHLWWKYVGLEGQVIGLDRFGASAPYKVLYEQLGLTATRIAEALAD